MLKRILAGEIGSLPKHRSFGMATSLLISLLVLAIGCSRDVSQAASENPGRTASALWGGGTDADTPEANVVVEDSCTGL